MLLQLLKPTFFLAHTRSDGWLLDGLDFIGPIMLVPKSLRATKIRVPPSHLVIF